MQVAHLARTQHLRKIGHSIGQRNLIGKDTMESILDEIHIGHLVDLAQRALRAVRLSVRAQISNLVAVGESLAVCCFRDLNAAYAQCIEREQFISL